MLFNLWSPTPYRATGDLDLLGLGDASVDSIVATVQDVCMANVPDDGVTFVPDTMQAVSLATGTDTAPPRSETTTPGARQDGGAVDAGRHPGDGTPDLRSGPAPASGRHDCSA